MTIPARWAAFTAAAILAQSCSLFEKKSHPGTTDAGMDSGSDAGVKSSDGGSVGDGGNSSDGGTTTDGGTPVDGGTPLGDGGSVDGGGPPPDDGGMPDGGPNGVFVDTLAGNGMAGNTNGSGNANGTAEFNAPAWVAVGPNSTFYISDTGNNRIRLVSADGGFTTATFAGSDAGSENGPIAMATFAHPGGIAVNGAGILYVTDTGNNCIRAVAMGMVSTLAGANTPGFADGTGPAAFFNAPTALALDSSGNLYVTDTGNNAIREVTPNGVVTTLAGPSPMSADAGMGGFQDGQATSALFNAPTGIAVNSNGTVYVADSQNARIRSVAFSMVGTVAGTGVPGFLDGMGGPGGTAQMNLPMGMSVDSAGNIYFGDSGNARLRTINPASGVVATLAGNGTPAWVDGATGPYGDAAFVSPTGVAFGGAGRVIVADSGANRIRYVTGLHAGGAYVASFSGNGGAGLQDGTGGPFGTALFSGPRGMATDSLGNIYVADALNNAVRKIDQYGYVTTVAGGSTMGGYMDGPALAARFNAPTDVAVDSTGNIFVADNGNHRLRKIDALANVTTVAGNGNAGFPDGTGGPNGTAEFGSLNSVALYGNGNLLVSDGVNCRIREVNSSGDVTTLSGSGIAGKLNGTGGVDSTAQFNNPAGIAVDTQGNAYVADYGNNLIRMIDSSGNATTLAGSGMAGDTDGTVSAAQFTSPTQIAIDGAGNLYVTDADNYVRMISGGKVTTIAGNGTGAVANGTAASAEFNRPYGIAIDQFGDIFISDFLGNDVRLILGVGLQ